MARRRRVCRKSKVEKGNDKGRRQGQGTEMRRRNQHRHEHPSEERLRRIVAASGLSPGQEKAGLAFARELDASMHRAPDPDFSRRTKLVVAKWFRRGMHGRALWRVGEAVMEWRFGRRR